MNDKKRDKNNLLVLITLDGWGIEGIKDEDVFNLSKTPNIDKNISMFPSTTLNLRKNTNDFIYEKDLSEFGYYSIGAGREDYKNLSRIDKLIENKKFYKNKILIKAINNTNTHSSKLHVIGLLSEAKKYSSLNHLESLLKLIKKEGVREVYLHLILDGVDTPPQTGLNLIKKINEIIKKNKSGKIATVSGRFYAMDRNYFWEKRTEKVYKTMVLGEGNITNDIIRTIKNSYSKKIYDKEFPPTILREDKEESVKISDNDSIISFNFSGERLGQLSKAILMPELNKFNSSISIKNLYFVSFVDYEDKIPAKTAFPIDKKNNLSKKINRAGLNELRIGDINKLVHIDEIFDGFQERIISEKDIISISSDNKDFNLSLIESSTKIFNQLNLKIKERKHNFILANLANFDLSSQQKNINATMKYIETVDRFIGKLTKLILNKNCTLVLTSTCSIKENIFNDGKESSYNFLPLPLIVINKNLEGKKMRSNDLGVGDLSLINPKNNLVDVHYTILDLLGIKNDKTLI